MKTTDQIASEAAHNLWPVFTTFAEREHNTAIIKSAIEKAVTATESRCAGEAAEMFLNHPRAAHASEQIQLSNRELQIAAAHSPSEEWTGDYVANTFNINAWDVCDKIADAHNLAIDLSRAAHASEQP